MNGVGTARLAYVGVPEGHARIAGMSFAPLVVLAEHSESAVAGINPYWIGGGVLLLLVVIMGGLLVFGRGRDHS